MSELTRFRDHCRQMAEAEHKPECPSLKRPGYQMPEPGYSGPTWMGLQPVRPVKCDGCNSAKDRALFARLADEVDEYEGMQMTLWGDA